MNTAMILAAGRGERMRPLTDQLPKPLLSAGGQPLIVWHIQALARAGFTRLVINCAHLGHLLPEHLGNGERWGVSIHYSHEPVALETAGGIAHAWPLLAESPFLVVNGDVWTDFDFAGLRTRGLANHELAHLVLVDNPTQHPQGDFVLHADGRVGMPATGEPCLTFSGIGCYDHTLFAGIRAAAPLAPVLRTAMAASRVSGEYYAGAWHDIGTPARLEQLNHALCSADDGCRGAR